MEKGLKPLSQILIHCKQNLNKNKKIVKTALWEKNENEKGTNRTAEAF